MSLSSSTLLMLQKVGTAATAADTKLKAEVKDYSQRVHEAMLTNPDGQKSDALFASWKVVMRLSQAMSGIEGELKKLLDAAHALGTAAPVALAQVAKPAAPKRTLAAKPVTPAAPAAALVAVSRTKPVKVSAKSAPKAAPKSAPKSAQTAVLAKKATSPAAKSKLKSAVKAAPAGPVTLGANPAKVLRHLETLLNAQDFTVISQTVVSKETGIPLGSMTAATKKLLSTGHLLAGPSGSFKLAHAPAVAA